MRKGRLAAAASLLIGVVLLGAPPAAAQPPVQDWVRTVPNGVGEMMDLDRSDNVFVLGRVGSIVTRKYDRAGALLWERPYPTPGERALPTWIATDPAGNAFVTAYRIAGSTTPVGWVVFKYDPEGTLLWKDVIPVSTGKTIRVETDNAGNTYVVGNMAMTNSGYYTTDAVIIKYAPNGSRLWTRNFSGDPQAVDKAFSVAVSGDGSRVAMVGQSGGAAFTVIYSSQGTELGRNRQANGFEARDAAFGPKNELYVGTATWTPETSNRMTLLKFGPNGNLLWTRSYPAGDWVFRLTVDSQDNAIATGIDQGPNAFTDWVTLKVNPAGTALWSRRYDGHQRNDEVPYFLALDPSNGIYVTGAAGPRPPGSMSASDLQMTTIKYAPNGVRRWVLFNEAGRGVSVRIGTDRAIYLQGFGSMLTARYVETAP